MGPGGGREGKLHVVPFFPDSIGRQTYSLNLVRIEWRLVNLLSGTHWLLTCSLSGTAMAFLSPVVSWERGFLPNWGMWVLGFLDVQAAPWPGWQLPKTWPDRNGGCTPLADRVVLTVAILGIPAWCIQVEGSQASVPGPRIKPRPRYPEPPTPSPHPPYPHLSLFLISLGLIFSQN